MADTTYATVQQLKDEGAPTGAADPRLQLALNRAAQDIDRYTRQWFEKRGPKTLVFDGHGGTILHLPVPAVSVSRVYTVDSNDVETDIDARDWTLYAGSGPPDNRRNPKIVFTFNLPTGTQNVRVTGYFGFVEDDESVPIPINKACLKMALAEVSQLADPDRRDVIDRGRIVRETTDRHSYQLGGTPGGGDDTATGPTGDPEIDRILADYRAPPVVGFV